MENKISIAVKGIICCRNRILIVKRSEFDEIGAGEWEFPGGRIKFGESPERALEREAEEETGLRIDVKEIAYASGFKASDNQQIIFIYYLCTSNRDMVTLSEEHGDYMWVRPDRLCESISEDIRNDVSLNYEKILRFIKCMYI